MKMHLSRLGTGRLHLTHSRGAALLGAALLTLPAGALPAFSGGSGLLADPWIVTTSDTSLNLGNSYYEMSSYLDYAYVNLNIGSSIGGDILTITGSSTTAMDWISTIGNAVADSGTVKVTGGATWGSYNELHIGDSGTGTLTVEAGSRVYAAGTFIGYNGTGTGTATVTGTNAKLVSFGGDMHVGESGTGIVTVENGGLADYQTSYIGYGSTGTGTVTVTGAGSAWTSTSNFYVGESGNGTLNIEGGSVVTDATGYIGHNGTGTGIVTLTGGSTWTNTADLYVGDSGTGSLNIKNGSVTDVTGYIGYSGTGTGTVTVTGASSSWIYTSAAPARAR